MNDLIVIQNKPIALPYTISIENSDDDTIVLEKVLRYLPGKRIVAEANYQGKKMLIKWFFHPTKAKRHFAREIQGLKVMMEAGLSTPALYYKGMFTNMPGIVLMVEWLNGRTLNALIDQDDLNQGSAWFNQLIDDLASLHHTGSYQHDLHLSNFIWQEGKLYHLDGGSVKQTKQPLTREKSLKNLGLLCSQVHNIKDNMLEQIYHYYRQKRNWPQNSADLLSLKKMMTHTQAQRQRRYLNKIMRSSTLHRKQRTFTHLSICRKDYLTLDFMKLMDNLDTVIDSQLVESVSDNKNDSFKTKLLKKGNTSTIVSVMVDNKPFVIKRYNIKNSWHAFRRSCRPSRAMISWYNAHLLQFHAINTPKPIAVIEKRWGALRSKAYFIMEMIEGVNAYDYFQQSMIMNQQAEQSAKNIVTLLKQLQKARIVHGDLKATNIILHGNVPYIIDLDALQQISSVDKYQHLLQKDQQRFLANWQDKPEVLKLFQSLLDK